MYNYALQKITLGENPTILSYPFFKNKMHKFIIGGTINNNGKTKTLLDTNVDFREVYTSQNVKKFLEIVRIVSSVKVRMYLLWS